MAEFSIVIICRNEASVIAKTLQSLQGLTDDIVVYDNGSTDGTQEVVKQFNVQLHEGNWEGFGKTKNRANNLAKNDWILSLDADEGIDEELKQSLQQWRPENNLTVYTIRFKNFLGNQYLKYGEWRAVPHIRVFNKKVTYWDDAAVHEKVVLPPGAIIKKLKGYVLHKSMKDLPDYASKMVKYAMLNAEKYHSQGRKASWIKLRLSPGFTFFNYYILKGGFLDGYTGYVCARMTAWYTLLKYARLKELQQADKK